LHRQFQAHEADEIEKGGSEDVLEHWCYYSGTKPHFRTGRVPLDKDDHAALGEQNQQVLRVEGDDERVHSHRHGPKEVANRHYHLGLEGEDNDPGSLERAVLRIDAHIKF